MVVFREKFQNRKNPVFDDFFAKTGFFLRAKVKDRQNDYLFAHFLQGGAKKHSSDWGPRQGPRGYHTGDPLFESPVGYPLGWRPARSIPGWPTGG